MAAVIDIRTGAELSAAVQRHQVATRPQLSLIQGGACAATPSPQVYRRRRIAVVVAAVLLVGVVSFGVRALAAAVVLPAGPMPTASGEVHVVAPGDTLWALAAELAPSADRRDVVDDLVALNSTPGRSLSDQSLQVGQELRLPVLD